MNTTTTPTLLTNSARHPYGCPCCGHTAPPPTTPPERRLAAAVIWGATAMIVAAVSCLGIFMLPLMPFWAVSIICLGAAATRALHVEPLCRGCGRYLAPGVFTPVPAASELVAANEAVVVTQG